MLLDELVGVIETIQGRIRDHGASLRENEIRTRMVLIDPLLQALGWDVADPGLVTPEYIVNGKRADYALLGGQGSPVVFLEAKRLDENLANHRSQVIAYASELGIKYPALTNGNDWEVYDNSKLVPIEQRSVLQVSVAKDPVHQTALKLLLLWRPNLASGQPVPANEPIIAPNPVQTPAPKPVDSPAAPDPQPPASPPPGWTRLDEFQSAGGKQTTPSTVRLPDGLERQLEFWYSLTVEIAEYLVKRGRLAAAICPVKSGRTRYIVHTDPRHSDGRDFSSHHQLSNGLFLEKNMNSGTSINASRFLLKHFGEDAAAVWLKFN